MPNIRELKIRETDDRWVAEYRDYTETTATNGDDLRGRNWRPAAVHSGGELQNMIVLALQSAGADALATQISSLVVADFDATFTAAERREGVIEYAQDGQYIVRAFVREADGSQRMTGKYPAKIVSGVKLAISEMVRSMGHTLFADQVSLL